MWKLLSSPKLFQLFVIIILSILCILLNKLTTINFYSKKIPDNYPEYQVSKLYFNLYNKNGKLIYNIVANQGWRNKNNNKVFLTNLKIKAYNKINHALLYTLVADDGYINYDKKIGFLGHNVLANIKAIKMQDEITMTTNNVTLDFISNNIYNNDYLHVVQNNNIISAVGFNYAIKQHLLKLNSKIKILYNKEYNH